MSDSAHDKIGPPPAFFVYYNPRVHLFKFIAIVAIALVLVALPFLVENTEPSSARAIAGFAAIFLIWAFMVARRINDRRPQVVVDTDGIYVRDWNSDIVPWQNIDFIAHSSSVRRGIVSALTRSRRGPYLLFKFTEPPVFIATLPPPFGFLQRLWTEIELQEPAIMEFGLDHKATEILRAIQDHIAYWQRTQNQAPANVAVVPPPGG